VPGPVRVAVYPRDVDETPTCPRHPDVETRLRCSSCDDLICPRCGVEAAVGYRCPECVRAERGDAADASSPSVLGRWFGATGPAAGGRSTSARPPATGPKLPTAVGARGTAAGLVAALLGGLLLGPILTGGTFLLISAGVIGWGVARAVYWATDDRSSPYLRAIALTAAGFSVAVGLVSAGATAAPPGLAFLAYPAAMYGGWIVVRQR
jgi:hypothetical protein